MSIVVSDILLPLSEDERLAGEVAAKIAGLPKGTKWAIRRRSIDARRSEIRVCISVELFPEKGIDISACLAQDRRVSLREIEAFNIENIAMGGELLASRPVVVGLGPAGMFASLMLARRGYRPVILERGSDIERRDRDIEDFLISRNLNPDSNIQFGEGGAGAYSDGKLTTRINDPLCETVLWELYNFGAPECILTDAHPHVGTDILKIIVKNIRLEIIRLGGEIHFNTPFKGIDAPFGVLRKVRTASGEIEAQAMILAAGHSARDTFESLLSSGVEIERKPFAAGVRIEHRQEDINAAMYGRHAGNPLLPPAEYRLAYHGGSGEACYSFCMCPGGYVMAAASESGGVVVNGMSRFKRDGENSNAALVLPVPITMFPSNHPLAGVELQRTLERTAFTLGGGDYRAPVQRVGDFLSGRASISAGKVQPTYPAGVTPGKIDDCLSPGCSKILKDALLYFGKKIKGFDMPDALLTAPETRTSSPVRILRRENMFSSSVDGLIPCGEGAGYAGGIMSAAVDGIRAAAALISRYNK